jgi:Plasmid pRiA4b ORF-3-like protein
MVPMHDMPLSFFDGLELKVTLRHIEPVIWRELRVPARLSLAQLHDVLQVALGWTNSHLHDFTAGDIRFGMDDTDAEIFLVDERAAPLGAIAEVGSTFLYRYDFGDDWEHDVIVERAVRDSETEIVCITGARACPPEDSGGPPGYEQLLATLSDPEHDEHQDVKRWVGRRFNPERFDLLAVNEKLATLARRFAPRPSRPA